MIPKLCYIPLCHVAKFGKSPLVEDGQSTYLPSTSDFFGGWNFTTWRQKKGGAAISTKDFLGERICQIRHISREKNLLTSPYLEYGVLASRQYIARVSKSFYFLSLTYL